MKIATFILLTAISATGLACTALGQQAAETGDPYRHHVGCLFGGSVKSDGKVAGTYGLEYTYNLYHELALGVFYEWSGGEYDAEGGGIMTTIALPKDFRLLLAFGLERELFADDELLFRVGANYNLHAGRFTFAPAAWLDFVNGKQILFAGLTAGIGF